MTVPADQAETALFLSHLAGAPPVETHISLIFLGEDTVWKLKKAVRLPFLDFSRTEDRHHFCLRELTLNAPAAPGLYRDVAPVVLGDDGSVTLGGPGRVIDWVVRMARVPRGDFLDVKAAESGLEPRLLDGIADAVAAYHGQLPPLSGVRPAMTWIADGNLTSSLAAGLPSDVVSAWHQAMTKGLASLETWTEARAQAGFVRRCHGDLHLGNMCLWQGVPAPFDALEFDEKLACIDVAYDLAFLLMDLEHRVNRASANRVLNRYIARTGDTGLVHGLRLFLSMRAMVRAHVDTRSGRPESGASYLSAASQYLIPHAPVVVGIGGLPGTGKSTLARALAPALGAAPGAVVVRSDELRKRQHGVEPERRLPETAYTPERSAAVFAALAHAVEIAASGGQAVIADATFMSADHRAMVEAAARRAGVNFIGLWLTAPYRLLEQRVAARVGDASDATVPVLRAAAKNDPGPGGWHAIDASNDTTALALAKGLLRSYIVF